MSETMTSSHTYTRERRDRYHEADVVVVGAGIFGCAAAYALANQGRSVLLLERSMQEPDRIVGELLQPGGLAALQKLGLGHCVEGIDAIPCYGYNVIYHGEPCAIPYPRLNEQGEVTHAWGGRGTEGAKQQGCGFHHGRFISSLRRACLGHENITVVETEVVKTIRGEVDNQILGVESRTTVDRETREKKDDFFFGKLTIVADGYDSKFRKQVLATKPVVKSKFYALELVDTVLPRPLHGHVIIGNAYPILLYQIGTHETRALFDVPQNIPEASVEAGGVRGYITKHAIPALPASVRPAAEKALAESRLRSMPNSWLPAVPQTPNGLVVLGDALNMRHPLTGGGMTVAFNDAVLLAELLHPARVPSLDDARAVRDAMHRLYWRRKNFTSIINTLAQALYSLFAADDRQLRALQMGCFEYFRRGWTDGPAGLLGGIIQRPLVLAYHFFYVAFVAIWMNAANVMGGPLGFWKLPLAVLDAVLILWKACIVFLPVIWREGFQ
ncbi:squalene monooxygenase-like protein [Trichoderma austrokoningii]